jgi:hypothetical protein
MDGTRDHHIKKNEPDSERQVCFLSYVESFFFNDMKIKQGIGRGPKQEA